MLRHAVQAYISLGHDDLGDDDSGGGGGGGGRNDIDVGCRERERLHTCLIKKEATVLFADPSFVLRILVGVVAHFPGSARL